MKSVIIAIASVISIVVFISTIYYATITNVKEGLDTPTPESLLPIPTNKGIPDGYYKYSSKYIAPVPYGYSVSTDKTQVYPKTIKNQWADISKRMDNNDSTFEKQINVTKLGTNNNENTKYSNDLSKIMDIQYHPSDAEIMKRENDGIDVSLNQTFIYDMSGNKIPYNYTKLEGNKVYYTPGSYTFGASSYVPKYEDSVYLSKTTGLSTTSEYRPSNMSGGFCNSQKNFPNELEQSCRKLDANLCASTDCCVLLGGSTCVAGNEQGPTQKTNYGDVYIRNKDYYYYRGKCYGNCST